MPVVHVTLPAKMHEELKELADEMGLSVSGLIKLFVKEALEQYRSEGRLRRRRTRRTLEEEEGGEGDPNELLLQVLARLDELQRSMEERFAALEGDMYKLRATVNNLKRRVSRLEDIVEDKIMPVEVDTSELYTNT